MIVERRKPANTCTGFVMACTRRLSLPAPNRRRPTGSHGNENANFGKTLLQSAQFVRPKPRTRVNATFACLQSQNEHVGCFDGSMSLSTQHPGATRTLAEGTARFMANGAMPKNGSGESGIGRNPGPARQSSSRTPRSSLRKAYYEWAILQRMRRLPTLRSGLVSSCRLPTNSFFSHDCAVECGDTLKFGLDFMTLFEPPAACCFRASSCCASGTAGWRQMETSCSLEMSRRLRTNLLCCPMHRGFTTQHRDDRQELTTWLERIRQWVN